jgi:hypothetical protein
MGPFTVLDASNAVVTATTELSTPAQSAFSAPPLGKNESGELALKVVLAGSSVDTAGTIAVTSQPRQFSTASTGTPVVANGTAFTIAANQIGFIQNEDDAALYVKLGASASATDFNYILRASDATDDGKGGSILIDNWIGVVSIFAATGVPRASAFLLT